jgi:hypothetical protein
MTGALENLNADQRDALREASIEQRLAILADLDRLDSRDRLSRYRPYIKQRQFHDAGATHSERLFMAGNQLGKTLSGGSEWAMHLTGLYPTWWQGAVFDKPPVLWAGSVTSEATRDNPQRMRPLVLVRANGTSKCLPPTDCGQGATDELRVSSGPLALWCLD